MTPQQHGVGWVGPWFRNRRRLATSVAVVLTGAIIATGFALPRDRVALSALLGLPIALVAVSFGTRGGMTAGLVGLAVVAAWSALANGEGVGIGGWAAGASMLVLGALLGEAVDTLLASEEQARQATDAHRRLVDLAARRREAVEINDTLVQSAAMAKWALEAGDLERALVILDETVDAGQRLVTQLINDSAALDTGRTGPSG
jgi:hypothetical protein